MNVWKNYGQMLKALDRLFWADNDYEFFTDRDAENFFARQLSPVTLHGHKVTNFFESIDDIYKRLAKRAGIEVNDPTIDEA